MKLQWDEKDKNESFQWGLTIFLVIAACILFYYTIFHTKTVINGIHYFIGIMAPILYGLAIAYLLSGVVNFLEQKIAYPLVKKLGKHPQRKGKRVIRWICVILSMMFFLFIIYTLIMMILPQLIRSITSIITNFSSYVDSIELWLNSISEKQSISDETLNETLDLMDEITNNIQQFLSDNILPQIEDMMKSLSSGVLDVLVFLKNFLIGAIVSLYVLADKELFVAKGKMAVCAVFPQRAANIIIRGMRFTHKALGGFIGGKIVDSAIIGVLCYIGTSFIGTPYNVLVSAIIGVTNVIPFFGPYLGAIPCILLIFIVNPLQSLYFIIFILALQQFDGNVLGPKILSGSTGLSSFMVIVAIMVGGGLFGIPGMVLGVPVFAVLQEAFWTIIRKLLHKKEIPDQAEEYIGMDYLDPETGALVPMQPKQPKEKRENRHNRPDGPDRIIRHIRQLWSDNKAKKNRGNT